MKPRNTASIRRQIDRRFEGRSLASTLAQPRNGWIRTTRQALGMRLVDLAKQLHLTEGALRQNESAELNESITMKHLRRAAEGMGCELVYAIIPKTSLENLYEDQIRKRAVSDANRTARTMELEQQGVSSEVTERQVEDLFREYMRDPPKDLWDE